MKGRNFHLVHAINSQPWHMRAETVWGYLPFAISVMKGESPAAFFDEDDDSESSEERKKKTMERWKSQFSAGTELFVEDWYYDYLPLKINGNVVVIPIMGAITQDDYCGTAGTKTIRSWYEKAQQDPDVIGVIELANSGGGSVFGTHELADYKLSYTKPILTLTEGLCCSAMMYIAAGSSYRMASSPNCILGSIGVMTTFVDFTQYYANEGINVMDLYSKGSPLKNDAHRRAMEGDMKGYTDGVLFKLDQSFMAFMQQQMPNVSAEALKGADYTSNDAIKNGLLDEIGTFQQAYDKVISLSQESKTSNNQTPNKMSKKIVKMSNALAGLAAIFGAEILDDTQENGETKEGKPNEEKPDEEKPNQEEAKPKDEEKPKEESEANADKKEIAALQARIDALERKPAGNATKVLPEAGKEETPKGGSKKEKTWMESGHEHVQRARQAGLL